MPEAPAGAAALAGTYRHEWLEYCLKNSVWDAREHVGDVHPDTPHGPIRGEPLSMSAAEDVNCVLDLVAKIIEPDDELHVEVRLDLSHYFGGTPDGDGTADVMIYKAAKRHLILIDAKFGTIEVSPESEQLTQYGLGGLRKFKSRGVDKITLWIAQPRSATERHKKHTLDVAELFDEGLALKADYELTKLDGQPYVVGKHCRWCKRALAGACVALRQHSETHAAAGFSAITTNQAVAGSPRLSSERVGDMLEAAEPVRVYLKALDELAENEARVGRVPRGRKWVATPGRRIFDPACSERAIANEIEKRMPGVDPWAHVFKTPPTLEKQIGREAMKGLADLITKTSGGFSLVPESDKRPAVTYSKAAQGFEAVANANAEE